ncbi:unnamed protein product [Chrysoparadoxa australica]
MASPPRFPLSSSLLNSPELPSTLRGSDARSVPAEKREEALLSRISDMYKDLAVVREQKQKAAAANPLDAQPPSASGPTTERVILVSRRLPYTIQQGEEGQWKASTTSANQALQNLRAVHEKYNSVWIGLPGTSVLPSQQMALKDMLKEHRLLPIYIDAVKEECFYSGFCRTVLWPLCHSSMPTTEDTIASHDVDSIEEQRGEVHLWQAYKSVNQIFADAIQEIYRDGDLIWVHDYHLMLLPQMLRSLIPTAKISFYLHLPFPSSEIYRILPYREPILEGLLSSDLIGFQTYDYARHFLSTVESLLDADCAPRGVEYNGHFANVAICPVGIDPDHWMDISHTPEVLALKARWTNRFKGKTVLLGVDGLDTTKGLVHKFLAIEEMFDRDPSLASRIYFVQVCFGGGSQFRERQLLEQQIHGFVGRINSKLASIDEVGPVQFFLDINMQELCALYSLSDVLIITPIRDGMNIVPFEYIISREAHNEVATVVLSEFAGCARSLGGAILVNPWNTTDMVETILAAMEMDPEERHKRHQNMSSYARNFTSDGWCTRSIEQLREANEGWVRTAARLLHKEHVLQSFAFSQWRLMIFSLEGVLSKATAMPELVTVPEEVVESLKILAEDPYNMVVIKSPRGRETLEHVLGDTNCVLAAEHGAFIRWGSGAKWEVRLPGIDMSWAEDIEPLLQYYAERTPGSIIEQRECSYAWHYSECDLGHGSWQAKQLHVSLLQVSRRLPITVYTGDKYLEIVPQALNALASDFLESIMARMRQLLNLRTHAGGKSDNGGDAFETVITGVDIDNGDGVVMLERHNSFKSHLSEEVLQGFNSNAYQDDEARLDEEGEGIFGTNAGSQRGSQNDRPGSKGSSTAWSSCSESSASTDAEDVVGDEAADVDFVLVVAGGQDLNDEDIFEAMMPMEFELEDFVKHVGLMTADEGEEEDIMMVDGVSIGPRKRVSLTEEPPRMTMAELAMVGGTPENLPSSSRMLSKVDETKLMVGDTEGLGLQSKSSRRREITTQSRFVPRKEFPPTPVLFQAMRRKFGDNYNKHELPETPAACWSLVLSTQEGRKDTWRHRPSLDVLQETVIHSEFQDLPLATEQRRKTFHHISLPPKIDEGKVAEGYAFELLDDKMAQRPSPLRPLGATRQLGSSASIKTAATSADKAQRAAADSSYAAPTQKQEAQQDGDLPVHSRHASTLNEARGLELPINSFSCTVGLKLSQASYYMKSRRAVHQLFQEMSQLSEPAMHTQYDVEDDLGGGHITVSGAPCHAM